VIWLLLLPAGWCLAAVLLDAYGRQPIPKGEWDAIVVPGCKVRSDGSASMALSRRVRHAVELWKEERAPMIITTGGLGVHPPSEALVAGELAISLGVPPASIMMEDQSKNTQDNARFAAQLRHNERAIDHWRVLVVSDAYHAWRCERLFNRFFQHATARGSTPGWRLRVRGSLREVISIGLFMLR